MKKKIALICCIVLVAVSLLGVFAACNSSRNLTDEELRVLRSALYNLYKDDATEQSVSYKVRGEITGTNSDKEPIKSAIKWTIEGTDKVTVSSTKDDNGNYTINVPDPHDLEDDITYTLRATLVNDKGEAYTGYNGDENATYTLPFTRKVTHKTGPVADAVIKFDSLEKITAHGAEFVDQWNNTGYESVTWQEDGITVENIRGTSVNGCNITYKNPARFYGKSTLKISYTSAFKAIRLTLHIDKPGGFDGMKVDGATIDRVDLTVIIVLATPATTFETAPLADQTRVMSLEVFTSEVPELPEEIVPDVPQGITALTTPKEGTFKFAMWQGSNNEYYYGQGQIANSYYLRTTTDLTEAADFTITKVAGSEDEYTITVDGKYLEIKMTSSSQATAELNATQTEGRVWKWVEGIKNFVMESTFGETTDLWYFGNYGTNVSFSCNYIGRIATKGTDGTYTAKANTERLPGQTTGSQWVAHFVEVA